MTMIFTGFYSDKFNRSQDCLIWEVYEPFYDVSVRNILTRFYLDTTKRTDNNSRFPSDTKTATGPQQWWLTRSEEPVPTSWQQEKGDCQ